MQSLDFRFAARSSRLARLRQRKEDRSQGYTPTATLPARRQHKHKLTYLCSVKRGFIAARGYERAEICTGHIASDRGLGASVSYQLESRYGMEDRLFTQAATYECTGVSQPHCLESGCEAVRQAGRCLGQPASIGGKSA